MDKTEEEALERRKAAALVRTDVGKAAGSSGGGASMTGSSGGGVSSAVSIRNGRPTKGKGKKGNGSSRTVLRDGSIGNGSVQVISSARPVSTRGRGGQFLTAERRGARGDNDNQIAADGEGSVGGRSTGGGAVDGGRVKRGGQGRWRPVDGAGGGGRWPAGGGPGQHRRPALRGCGGRGWRAVDRRGASG